MRTIIPAIKDIFSKKSVYLPPETPDVQQRIDGGFPGSNALLPFICCSSRENVVWQVPLEGHGDVFVEINRCNNDDNSVVIVDSEKFLTLWVNSNSKHAAVFSELNDDTKFSQAEAGFSHGVGNPVPLPRVSAFTSSDGDNIKIDFDDGTTRTKWLLHHRAVAFPVEVVRRNQAEAINMVAGVGQPIITVRDLFCSSPTSSMPT